ncbi:hypothetical protein ACFVIA_38290, partial [Streptomyces virginiae]
PVPSPRGIAAAFAAGASGYVRQDERIEGVERGLGTGRGGGVGVAPRGAAPPGVADPAGPVDVAELVSDGADPPAASWPPSCWNST